MSRFNVREIIAPPPPPPHVIHDKKPSAYSAMKHGGPPVHVEEPKKKGRPSKEDVRKHKLSMADAGIQMLVETKPTRNRIREYFQSRIEELDEEKR